MPNDSILILSRRAVLIRGLAAVASAACVGRWSAAAASSTDTVTIENFAASGKSAGVVTLAKVIKSDAEWRSQLSPQSYQITRREGTEYAGTGPYTYNHADGLYRCICCGTALYDSKTKYDSGTGWPSFWQPISTHNVFTKTDRSFGDVRDAIACRLCDAHLGHVFPDGPKPTGLRYCMNSVALNFVARA